MVEAPAAVDRELSAIGAAVRERLSELTLDIWQLLTRSMPELRGDDVYEKLLDASIAENVETVLNVFEHGTAIDDVQAPAAAHEYARSLVSEQVILTYQRERDNWLLSQAAGRAGRVRALLADNPADLGEAEQALGYRLRGKHLGVVAWISGEPAGDKGLAELEAMAFSAARVLEARGRPLFVPRDEARAWIWLSIPARVEITHDLLEVAFDDGRSTVRVTAGEPAVGLEGFRLTHDQAVRTQNLALVASPGARVTTFAEVGALALICSDRNAARLWVLATLNDLAIDDESHARLRETLLVYLTTGSYTVTAERMMLHKNTAQYRVGRAEEALGRPVGERRADVELALRACHHLGRAVLRNPAQPAR